MFAQHGALAFVSRGKLWLLNARDGLRMIASPAGFTPLQPAFSPDGKWLAYLEQHTTASSLTSDLWLARSDGTRAHAVRGFQTYTLIGWQPRTAGGAGNALAVATGPERQSMPCPCRSPTTLRLISPEGPPRVLTRTSWLYDGAWSPDGRRIAVAEIGQKVSRIVVYPATGGRGQVWLRRTARQQLNDMNGAIVQIAGWWRNLGIGFWVFGNGMVHNNDAAPLDLVGAPGAEPITLGRTLSDGQTDELAANARGNVAIVAGGWRDAWAGKHVELCTSAGAACAVLPHPSKSVTVDPAWSPDGTTLAYGVAPSVRSGPWSQGNLSRWFTAHRVFLYDGATKKVRQLTVAHGATAITWSRDGKSLLYVRDDALWLLSSLGGTPTRVAAPLFSPGRWPQYYAQVPWAQQFAWSS